MVEIAPSLVCDNARPPASVGERRRATTSMLRQVSTDLFAPLLSGGLVAVCFMGPGFDVLAWIALIPFAWAIARSKGTAELYLGAYLGGALVHLHVLDFIRTRVGSAGLFASHEADWIANGLAWAIFWPLTLYLGRRFVRSTRLPMVCALPIIWITGEFLRQEAGWIVLEVPFPWLQIGTTQAPYLRVIQVADLAGPWAVAAAIAAFNGALFDALVTKRVRYLGVGLLILAVMLLYGELRLRETHATSGSSVSLVAGSIQPHEACRKPPKADLLLWSETAYKGNVSDPAAADIVALEADSKAAGATLIVGCVRRIEPARYNSAVVVDPLGGYLGCYDKIFLVPWSEFTPWSWPGGHAEGSRISPGTAKPVFPVAGFHCAISICYDACFDRSSRGYSPKPDFFVACSSESSDMTGYIRRVMLDMTRFRAIESRRAFVRNVKDGFSGVVDSTGEYTPAPDQPWTAPVSVGRVPIDGRTTFYEMAGNWLPISCCIAVAATFLRSRRRT